MPDVFKWEQNRNDSDALAYISAASLTNATHISAAHALIGGLKRLGLWSKMTAVYPFIGGTSGAHAINAKSPGTYNITWNGEVTHNANGITGNGTTGYGNTGLTPSVSLLQDNCHVSIYSRTNSTIWGCDIGCWALVSAAYTYFQIYLKMPSSFTASVYLNSNAGLNPITDSTAGFFVASRIAASSGFYKEKSKKVVISSATTNRPTVPIFIGARNENGTPLEFSTRNYSFCSIGSGLTDPEAVAFSVLVQYVQFLLGRAV